MDSQPVEELRKKLESLRAKRDRFRRQLNATGYDRLSTEDRADHYEWIKALDREIAETEKELKAAIVEQRNLPIPAPEAVTEEQLTDAREAMIRTRDAAMKVAGNIKKLHARLERAYATHQSSYYRDDVERDLKSARAQHKQLIAEAHRASTQYASLEARFKNQEIEDALYPAKRDAGYGIGARDPSVRMLYDHVSRLTEASRLFGKIILSFLTERVGELELSDSEIEAVLYLSPKDADAIADLRRQLRGRGGDSGDEAEEQSDESDDEPNGLKVSSSKSPPDGTDAALRFSAFPPTLPPKGSAGDKDDLGTTKPSGSSDEDWLSDVSKDLLGYDWTSGAQPVSPAQPSTSSDQSPAQLPDSSGQPSREGKFNRRVRRW